ncbi:MAG: multidrug effflux MFS transporter [Novosphingobium sp.]|nr:multidrug effflux MFS transporter [Novosphingobium sp.]MCP5403506.1 multidrug effflux MFS transporter [Novosphingobium sp.]
MKSPHSGQAHFAMGQGEFIALMAMLMALQALAIDVMLPALGVIARDLGLSDPNDRQLLIGVFLICSGLASLIPGSLSDRFGRKPVILVCLAAYFTVSLASALVTDFTVLLILRGVLGVFTSGLMVMPAAVLRDRFEGDRMASMQSLIAMVFMVVPMLAPLLGQGIMLVAGWRWIFGVMAGLALAFGIWTWLRLPETLHAEHRQSIRPMTILSNMRAAVTRRDALGYFLGAALVQSALLGYINSAQQLVAEALGAGQAFPAIFGVMALIMACTNFVNSRIVERFGARRVSQSALIGLIIVSGVHLALAMSGRETLWQFVPLMTVGMCFISFIGANFQAIALQPFARIAGAAASALAFIRLVAGASLGLLIGQAFDGTARPLTGAMLAAGVFALLLVLYSEKGRLFRRLHYPTPD